MRGFEGEVMNTMDTMNTLLRGNPMGWPDLHGFVGVRDEKGGGSDEHEEHVEELTHTTR